MEGDNLDWIQSIGDPIEEPKTEEIIEEEALEQGDSIVEDKPQPDEVVEETQDVTEEPTTQVDILAELRSRGFEINSQEDLVAALNQRKEFEQSVNDYKSTLSQYEEDEEVRALRAFREEQNASLKEYVELKYADYDTMSDEQLLWEQFKQENKGKNEQLLQYEFKNKLKDYTVEKPDFVDDEERLDWESKHQELINYKSLKKQEDIRLAKEGLVARKEKYAKIPTPTGRSQEEAKEAMQNFNSGISTALKDFQPIELSISDNNEEAFKLAADDAVKSKVESISKEPQELLSLVGMNSDGSIDFNKAVLAATVLTHVENGTLGKFFAEHVLSVKNAEIIERKLENPKDTKTTVSGGVNEDETFAQLKKIGVF